MFFQTDLGYKCWCNLCWPVAPFIVCHLSDFWVCIWGVVVYVTVLNISISNIVLRLLSRGQLWQIDLMANRYWPCYSWWNAGNFCVVLDVKEFLLLWFLARHHPTPTTPPANIRSIYKLGLSVSFSRSDNSSQSVGLETKGMAVFGDNLF